MHISLHLVVVTVGLKQKQKVKMPGGKSGACVWNEEYANVYQGITKAKNGKKDYCYCNPCNKDLSIHHKGKADIEKHIGTKEHQANCKKVAGTPTLHKLFNSKAFNFLCLFTVVHYFFLTPIFCFYCIFY